MPYMGKGARYERQLVNRLQERNYRVLRAPSSGAGTKEDKPDAIIGKGGLAIAVELKSGDSDYLYVEKEEVKQLNAWANEFGAVSRLVFRWTSQSTPSRFFFQSPSNVKDVGKNRRAAPEIAQQDGWPTEDNLLESIL